MEPSQFGAPFTSVTNVRCFEKEEKLVCRIGTEEGIKKIVVDSFFVQVPDTAFATGRDREVFIPKENVFGFAFGHLKRGHCDIQTISVPAKGLETQEMEQIQRLTCYPE